MTRTTQRHLLLQRMDVENKEGSLDELKEQIHFLTNENVQLDSKLSFMQSRTAQQAASNQDLSTRLVQSEAEKLKISKELVEVQINANKLREKHETEILELQKKVFCQEGVVSNLEAELTRLKHEAEAASLRLQVAERNKCDMAEEYAVLKSNFLSVSEALEHEITHTKELKDELLTLAHTHDTLLQGRRQNETHNPELQRVKALLSKLSHNKVRPEELQQGRDAAEDTRTHKTQNELWELLEKMRKSYEAQQQQLENKIVAMEKEQQENRRVIHSIQQDIAQQSATLLVSQQQLKDMEVENSNLQNQLKELNQEYRARLMHYIHDITESVQDEGEFSAKMKTFVDSMLKEVRVSYRAREEHLTSTLKTYRKRLHKIHNIHQQLLIAYRMQREQILVHTDRALEAGPPEANFSPSERELKGEANRELQRLRDDKSRLEAQLRIPQVAMLPQSAQNTELTEEAWADIRKQIREIAITTQEAYERERTRLVTRAAVAEEQASELQEYVNNHLDRYKMEITRLREMLEGFEAERSKDAELYKPRPHNQTLEKSNNEK